MAALSNYLENKLVDHVLRNTAYTSPTTVYVALYKSDPTDADSGTEVSGGSYARKAASFSVPSDGSTSNSADIEFPVATGSWGTVTHFGLKDALTSGNLLLHGKLEKSGTPAPKTIDIDDQLIFRSGELVATFE